MTPNSHLTTVNDANSSQGKKKKENKIQNIFKENIPWANTWHLNFNRFIYKRYLLLQNFYILAI